MLKKLIQYFKQSYLEAKEEVSIQKKKQDYIKSAKERNVLQKGMIEGLKAFSDKGNYGEYLTYNVLGKIPGYKKILTNVYLPTKYGTTEIDLIFLHETGVYVIESKNYSGWIFGNAKDKQWTQSLPGGHKFRFFNPIMQNHNHIQVLQSFLPLVKKEEIFSYIVFSDRCTLKDITFDDAQCKLVQRMNLREKVLKQIHNTLVYISDERIDEIHEILQAFTDVSPEIKAQHIKNIQQYKNR